MTGLLGFTFSLGSVRCGARPTGRSSCFPDVRPGPLMRRRRRRRRVRLADPGPPPPVRWRGP